MPSASRVHRRRCHPSIDIIPAEGKTAINSKTPGSYQTMPGAFFSCIRRLATNNARCRIYNLGRNPLKRDDRMDVNKIVCINRSETEQWCVFAHHWCGIPVFVTRDDNQSRSALYRDGTCFIILGSDLIKSRNPKFLYNRLWHEVAHLYYRDVWKPWDLRFEFRADLVASAATGKGRRSGQADRCEEYRRQS